MNIGSFGGIIFQVSDETLLTLSNFLRSGGARFAVSERLGQKPSAEYISPNQGSITFDIILKSSLGVNPGEMIDTIIAYSEAGETFPLIVGTKGHGSDKWYIETYSIGIQSLDANGDIASATAALTLKEYGEAL